MTDIYLDRYLPVSTLNLIRDATAGVITAYDENKLFLEIQDKKFKEMSAKIKESERLDKK